ncbi:patatin-like phospholipase family protein [Agromyces sp. NPDC058136]|uniref:patatin-like phospholipase family protein n=1 Tax=Agromyces sp. NPDC058136 TaxID=3346354 RepID=UPI0036D9FFAD
MHDNTPSSPLPATSTSAPGRAMPVDATNRIPASGERALVLGGGGSTGNAWLIGVVAGLSEAGVDVTAADLTIGTSAGSTAAAQLAGATPAELYAAIADAAPLHPTRPTGQAWAGATAPAAARPPAGRPIDHLARTGAIIAASSGLDDLRRRMGVSARELDASSDDGQQARWRATVASRFAGSAWPARSLLLTAVDAETGDSVVFDRDSGVDLVDAVAASCAGGFAFRIDGHPYIDGGYRTNPENADLAAGYERVLVLSPFGGRTRLPLAWGLDLATQVEALRAGGSRVETIGPRSEDRHLFDDAMNLALRPAAARAGYERGRELAERIGELWG